MKALSTGPGSVQRPMMPFRGPPLLVTKNVTIFAVEILSPKDNKVRIGQIFVILIKLMLGQFVNN